MCDCSSGFGGSLSHHLGGCWRQCTAVGDWRDGEGVAEVIGRIVSAASKAMFGG
jgi:hypothetical protein